MLHERAPHEFRFGDVSVTIEIVKDFEALLDECAENTPSDVDRIPYFATPWGSGTALAQYIATRFPTLTGQRVVELGCGSALPSLTAARLGADVLAVDFHPDNEPIFRRNVTLNGLTTARYLCADWTTVQPDGGFDLVIAGDVLYEARSRDSLLDTCIRLCAPSGILLLGDPGRHPLQEATDRLQKAGFQHDLHIVNDCFVFESCRKSQA